MNDPVLEIAKSLEEVALKDPYFVERKLYPNVDFLLWHYLQSLRYTNRYVYRNVLPLAAYRVDCLMERND